MKTLTFAQKLWLPLFLTVACLTAITAFDAWLLRQVRIEERENDLANNADNAVSLVRQYADLAQHGVLTRDVAQKEAMERIEGMRFGKDGYYTVMTDEPKMLMHPFKPELIGRTLGDFKDANGTLLYRDAVTRVESGCALVSETGTAIREIVGAVKRVDSIVHEIAAAAAAQSLSEQAHGLALVVAAFRLEPDDQEQRSLTHHPVSMEIADVDMA
ncbi:cache domain-containing protein [Paraburkholderia solitsugae]|uniref:cache domain-containing protein n=1 Tax=Paraburkholderia solitsugae TaxID=2675748 RepID=UPI001F4112D8|nr:cache domain-containing protein [Paraburkholderia solitsugae]